MYDATLLYSRVASYTVEQLLQSSSTMYDATLLYSVVASYTIELLIFLKLVAQQCMMLLHRNLLMYVA